MKTFSVFRGISPDNSRARYIDSVFDDTRRRLFGDETISGDHEFTIPHANITETDTEARMGYLIELAAPGFDRNDFDVSVFDDILTVKGEIHEDRRRSHSSFSRREHNYQTFSRSFTLPESVDEDNITANYRNGILEVFVPVLRPVSETKTPRRIEIGS